MTINDDTSQTQPYHCPGCDREVGGINEDGELVVGIACIEVGTFHCLMCGYRKRWRRSDSLLDRLTGVLDRQPSVVV